MAEHDRGKLRMPVPVVARSVTMAANFVDKHMQSNSPTADLVKSMAKVAETLHDSFTSLLSAAVRLAEVGQDEEARRLLALARKI